MPKKQESRFLLQCARGAAGRRWCGWCPSGPLWSTYKEPAGGRRAGRNQEKIEKNYWKCAKSIENRANANYVPI